MNKTLHIACDLASPEVEKVLAENVLNQPGLRLLRGPAERSAQPPDIIFLEDAAPHGGLLEKVHSLRSAVEGVHIFVVSSNPAPDHIIAVMKAGASEYFLSPLDPKKVRDAIERLRLQVVQGGKTAAGSVYAFIGSKGGLGTTLLAVNTALALAGEKSGRTALFDLALAAGDSGVLLDLVPKTTIADVAHNFSRLDASFLAGTMERHTSGVDLLAAPPAMEDGAAITAAHSERIVELLRSLYGTVVLDCPALGIDERSLAAVRQADRIFVVSDLSVAAVRNASRLLKHLGKSGIAPARIEVVVNRLAKSQAGAIEDVEKSIGRRVFWLFPNDFDSALAAANRGNPLLKYDPRCALARNIFEFARKIVEPAAFPNYRGIKGLLGKAI